MSAPAARLLFRLQPSRFRRIFGTAMLAIPALALVLVAIRLPSDRLSPRVMAVALALAGLALAWRLWRDSASAVELREDGLHCALSGRHLATLAQIERVESGALLLMKPASGFVVRLRQAQPAGRVTGMWWIRGQRLGIGGVTPKAQGRIMAAALTELLSERPPPP